MIFISINIILMIYSLLTVPEPAAGVSLVLPFTNVPGIGYLSFLHWIIAIFVLAIVHEFSHGIVAKANGLDIKSSGFAFFSLIAPIIPAAFVEPDEKKLSKQSDIVQYSIFAAGPMANIALAVILFLLFPFVANPAQLAPFEATITEPIGFSFDLTNSTLPAAEAGLQSGMIITGFEGEDITEARPFLEKMNYCKEAGETISISTVNETYAVTSAEVNGRGIIGISNIKNERRMKPEFEYLKHPFFWIKSLLRWLFLLNLFIGLFNLLPLGIVDGGRMLKTLLDSTMKNKKKATKLWGFISLFFLLALLLGLFVSYLGNPFAFLLR